MVTSEQAAERGGTQWGMEEIAALSAQRRQVAGGFPGTVSQARARVLASLGRDRARASQIADLVEQARIVKLFYAAARRVWMSHRETERDDPRAQESTCSDE